MITIGLIGHSFSMGNMGLGALAIGECEAIEKAANGIQHQVICFETSINRPFVPSDYNIKLEIYNLKDILGTARKFKKCDYLIDISAGDSFSDIYGKKLFAVQMCIKLAILLSGKPFLLAPQTIGPFKNFWAKFFSNYYIFKAFSAFSRDTLSMETLSKKNYNRVKVATDLAFLLPYNEVPKEEKFTVGFNVSGLLYNSNKTLNGKIEYNVMCNHIIETLIKNGINVKLVPHVILEDKQVLDNDLYVCKKLSDKYGLGAVPNFKSPVEVKSYISHFHFFIGSRMHATIAAVSSGVPTLALAYSRKFQGVFQGIKYSHVIDLNDADETTIISEIFRLQNDEYLSIVDEVERSRKIAFQGSSKYIKELKAVFCDN